MDKTIEHIVSTKVDEIAAEIVKHYDLQSGDLDPIYVDLLNESSASIMKVMQALVVGNQCEEE